ncbi:hypothetical protein A5678_04490 [Mycobacterium sp. E2733]|nr:hypothetical protein A5678_04490 [Mycobacterium sp. E2733]
MMTSGDRPMHGTCGLALVAEPDFSANPASLQVHAAPAHERSTLAVIGVGLLPMAAPFDFGSIPVPV